jgi:hypothetical protein
VRLAVALCASLALVFGAGLVVVTAHYISFRQEVDRACQGVVAELDLTEWVAVCR